MSFDEYCIEKKIDSKKFESTDPTLYNEWKNFFNEVSPQSFTQQKKFIINEVRNKYTLKAEPVENKTKTTSTPKIKIPGKAKPAGIKIPTKKG